MQNLCSECLKLTAVVVVAGIAVVIAQYMQQLSLIASDSQGLSNGDVAITALHASTGKTLPSQPITEIYQ